MTSPGKARAVVLAAGMGKRMKSRLPKVLHDVLGKSVIQRVLDAADALDLEHIHVVIGHGGDQVVEHIRHNPPATPVSFHKQEEQLGTGHAFRQALPALEGFSGTVFALVGDTPLLRSKVLAELRNEHLSRGASVSVLTAEVPDAKNYGRIVRSPEGAVVKIVEDKDADERERKIREVNTGIFCLEWPAAKGGVESLTNDNKQGEYYLTDLVQWASSEKKVVSARIAPDWKEVAGINSRIELAEATGLLRQRVIEELQLEFGVTVVDPASTWIAPEVTVGQDTVILPGTHIMGRVTIGSGSRIGPNTVIKGPVTIGDFTTVMQSRVVSSGIGSNCTVGPFAHLRDGAHVVDRVRIGNFVELKKCNVGAGTNVSHLSYVGDAEVGSDANIGAGTITANYDHISKQKSQTVIKDGASTGSNSVLVAPVTVGEEASVAAGTVVTRDVPDRALAVGRIRQENKEGWSASKKKKLAARAAEESS